MSYDIVIRFLIAKGIRYLSNYPTYKMSSFELGGNARIVAFPESVNDFCDLMCFLRESNQRYYILGNASNTFFSENGYDGVIVSTRHLDKVFCDGNRICAMCGAQITDLSALALKNGLTGLEFCFGIPGSVGGAVFMNASAFDASISDVVLESEILDTSNGKRYVIDLNGHSFERKSSALSKNKSLVLLSTSFILGYGDKLDIYSTMRKIALKRMASQPLEGGNCGSTFKRPLNAYASKLIDEAGLKGARIGGVAISEKHAGFIVNFGDGTSNDALSLIGHIKAEVQNKFGITLEEEIIFVE